MTTYFFTLHDRRTGLGMALPISEKYIAQVAVNKTGGGYSPAQTRKAVALNAKMLAGTWTEKVKSDVLAIARLDV